MSHYGAVDIVYPLRLFVPEYVKSGVACFITCAHLPVQHLSARRPVHPPIPTISLSSSVYGGRAPNDER